MKSAEIAILATRIRDSARRMTERRNALAARTDRGRVLASVGSLVEDAMSRADDAAAAVENWADAVQAIEKIAEGVAEVASDGCPP